MQSIITVVGKDQVGIISSVCSLLEENNVNVLDISQTIKKGYFNMFMIVKLHGSREKFTKVNKNLNKLSEQLGIEISMQRTELFDEMYKISGGCK